VLSPDHLRLQDGVSPLNRRPSPLWSIASVASVPSSGTAIPRRTRPAQPSQQHPKSSGSTPTQYLLHCLPLLPAVLFSSPAYTLLSEHVKSAESRTTAAMDPFWPGDLRPGIRSAAQEVGALSEHQGRNVSQEEPPSLATSTGRLRRVCRASRRLDTLIPS
jgi:hypothetical protein